MNQERAQAFLRELPSVRNDLPFSPALLTRLFTLTADEGASPLEAIAEAIAEDQGLSTRVLAMANSAYYGLQARVGSVARAVAVLGLREVRGMVLALGMQGLTRRHPLPEEFVFPVYLEHQVSVAVAAMALAQATGSMHPDDAFTAGLLHDLGKLLTALYRPEDWQAQAVLAVSQALAWHEAEQRHWGLDHGLIGAMVLGAWNLPETLTEPVNWHHAPQADPTGGKAAALVGLADACVRHAPATPAAEDSLLVELARKLGLAAQDALTCTEQALARRDPAAFGAALG